MCDVLFFLLMSGYWDNLGSGFQVVISSRNASLYLERCFNSLNNALNGVDWILHFGDDDSEDDTLNRFSREATSDAGTVSDADTIKDAQASTDADSFGAVRIRASDVHIYAYKQKAINVAKAKNRILPNLSKYSKSHPVILFMDADDIMLPERAKLYDTAISNNAPWVVGSWQRDSGLHVNGSIKLHKGHLGPWSTLLHHDIIKDYMDTYGAFFYEGVSVYEDMITLRHVELIKQYTPCFHTSHDPVHVHHRIPYSLSHSPSIDNIQKMEKALAAIVSGKDIYLD